MSIEAICITKVNDQNDLVQALKEIYGNCIKVVPDGVKVKGYMSQHRPTVLIDKRGFVGTVGFFENKDGNFELVYDISDAHALTDILPRTDNGIVINRLMQTYSKVKVIKAMKSLRKGKSVEETVDENGSIMLRVRI